MARRHLEPHEWGAAFKMLLKVKGVKRTRGPKAKDDNSATVAEIASEAGVPERTARQRMQDHDDYESFTPAEQKAVDSKQTTIGKLKAEKKPRCLLFRCRPWLQVRRNRNAGNGCPESGFGCDDQYRVTRYAGEHQKPIPESDQAPTLFDPAARLPAGDLPLDECEGRL